MSNKRDSASLIQLMIVTGAISMKTSIKSSGQLVLGIFCLLSGCATSDYSYTSGDIDRYVAGLRYNQALYNQQSRDLNATIAAAGASMIAQNHANAVAWQQTQRDVALSNELRRIDSSINNLNRPRIYP
jgi:hypothetical protein